MDHNHLFTIRIKADPSVSRNVSGRKMVVIHAFDGGVYRDDGRTRIDVEVRHGGEVVFKRGQLYCGVNRWTSIDGIAAKELVLSLVAMKPGDTDSEYFESYTPAQLAFARTYGEELDLIRQMRYCDENGDVRSKGRG